jgi:hypothetical protein
MLPKSGADDSFRTAFAEIGQVIAEVFPGLLQQNGPKKEKEPTR